MFALKIFGGPPFGLRYALPRRANLTTSPLDACMTATILFKVAVLVYQCLNGLAPSYLTDDCQLVSDVRPSASSPFL